MHYQQAVVEAKSNIIYFQGAHAAKETHPNMGDFVSTIKGSQYAEWAFLNCKTNNGWYLVLAI